MSFLVIQILLRTAAYNILHKIFFFLSPHKSDASLIFLILG
jgi:hypothetical protein